MRDVVVVPTYERPEFAWVCLEYLARARGVQDKEVWLCQDSHEDGVSVDPYQGTPEIRELAVHFRSLFKNVGWHCMWPHKTYGNSKNIIQSLRRAYESGAERIFLLEDDIMVMPDFFEWHEAVLREINPFVSCATSVNKSAHFPINGRYAMDDTFADPDAYYISHSAYSSHAAAYTRQNLGELLSCAPADSVWAQGKEQDLWVQRVLSVSNEKSAWPYVPRAYNVGIYSYHINVGMKFNGTLAEKTTALRSAIRDPQKLRDMGCNNQAVTPVPDFIPQRVAPILYQARKYR